MKKRQKHIGICTTIAVSAIIFSEVRVGTLSENHQIVWFTSTVKRTLTKKRGSQWFYISYSDDPGSNSPPILIVEFQSYVESVLSSNYLVLCILKIQVNWSIRVYGSF